MRLFFLITLLFSFTAFAQDCTENDLLIEPTTTFNCAGNLIIDSDINLSSKPGPIKVVVGGEVRITAKILLNGGIGPVRSGDGPGGSPAPGAGTGGGQSLGGAEPGLEPFGFPYSSSTPGNVTGPGSNCGNGGGGGGFATGGDNGAVCNEASPQPAALAGSAVVRPAEFDFNDDFTQNVFRGGAGGGGGAIGATGEYGSGGGGGGGIMFDVNGDIFIGPSGLISAQGGRGGDTLVDGGGGGGGSGGVIWLRSLAGFITVQGTLNVQPGRGGTSPTEGNGGKGAPGIIRLTDLNQDAETIGIISTPLNSSTQKLNSSISCGTVGAPRENDGVFYQVALGIVLVTLFKKLLLLRKKT